MPPSIVNFESLSSFRNSLNNVKLRIYDVLNAVIVLLCILFYLVGLAIFMSYFLAFVFILLLSDFNMFDVLYDTLVALVALCHL